jgi:hypothetical protein
MFCKEKILKIRMLINVLIKKLKVSNISIKKKFQNV